MTSHVSLQNISKYFKTKNRSLHVLEDINLTINQGEFVAIVGASGCGKSTLLRLLMNLEESDSGSIEWTGSDTHKGNRNIGVVFQDHRLFPWLTVIDNVVLGLEFSQQDYNQKREKAFDILKLVGLENFTGVNPPRLSGGMAQRAAIARALVGSPDMLLLDEPFGALDAFTRLQLQQELENIWQRDKITTVLVTHDIEEAVFLADRIIVLEPRPGRILEDIKIDLPRPRTRSAFQFNQIKDSILSLILNGGQDGWIPEAIVDKESEISKSSVIYYF